MDCLLRGWWGRCYGPGGLCSQPLGGPGQHPLLGMSKGPKEVCEPPLVGYFSFGDDSLFWEGLSFLSRGAEVQVQRKVMAPIVPLGLCSAGFQGRA